MRKKTQNNDSNIMGEDSTQMTLVDEVISRVPTVLLRIVFAYASRYSEALEIASRWNAASFDDLETLIRELIQEAKVDVFYGKLLVELAYKDKRFQQDYYSIEQDLTRHLFLQLIFKLVNRMEFRDTFNGFSCKLSTSLPNLFSPDFHFINT